MLYIKGGSMPPVQKVSREDILNCCLEILRTEELTALNARKIAKHLNCSVQPIFYNFANMEELKTTIYQEIYALYQKAMNAASMQKQAYKEMGLAYIKFAATYPNYFKILFMQKTEMSAENFIVNDNGYNNIILKGQELTGFTAEEQVKFHLKVWIFTHGLATLVATSTVQFKEEQIKNLLETSVREMLIGARKESYEKNN